MAARPVTWRSLALLAAAALALHELRYEIAPQAHEARHGYLSWVTPIVATLVALGAGAYVLALARAREAKGPVSAVPPARFAALWPAASIALAAMYGVQELVEGVLAAGHAAGAAAAVAHGGWVGFLLAPALGALVAVLLRGADAVLARVARGAPEHGFAAPPPGRPEASVFLALDPLARNLAGRGPPLTG
jgi:hypothetical protein